MNDAGLQPHGGGGGGGGDGSGGTPAPGGGAKLLSAPRVRRGPAGVRCGAVGRAVRCEGKGGRWGCLFAAPIGLHASPASWRDPRGPACAVPHVVTISAEISRAAGGPARRNAPRRRPGPFDVEGASPPPRAPPAVMLAANHSVAARCATARRRVAAPPAPPPQPFILLRSAF